MPGEVHVGVVTCRGPPYSAMAVIRFRWNGWPAATSSLSSTPSPTAWARLCLVLFNSSSEKGCFLSPPLMERWTSWAQDCASGAMASPRCARVVHGLLEEHLLAAGALLHSEGYLYVCPVVQLVSYRLESPCLWGVAPSHWPASPRFGEPAEDTPCSAIGAVPSSLHCRTAECGVEPIIQDVVGWCLRLAPDIDSQYLLCQIRT